MAKANALQKPLTPSAELSAVIGPGPHTRAEATSKLWGYIKDNGCQNPENKREIVADPKCPSRKFPSLLSRLAGA
jgi:upstream activation factor subunit UAF30